MKKQLPLILLYLPMIGFIQTLILDVNFEQALTTREEGGVEATV